MAGNRKTTPPGSCKHSGEHYGPNNPPRLRNPGESVEDYRVAMGWDEPKRVDIPNSVGPSCEWHKDDEGIWRTGCGTAFTFDCDGPRENKFNYCHHCGKSLVVIVDARGSVK